MNNVNTIVICRNEFKSENEFEHAIKDAVMCLLTNNYIMTVNWDDKELGYVVINFNYANEEYGDYYPYWLSPDEIDSVVRDGEREEMKRKELNENEC